MTALTVVRRKTKERKLNDEQLKRLAYVHDSVDLVSSWDARPDDKAADLMTLVQAVAFVSSGRRAINNHIGVLSPVFETVLVVWDAMTELGSSAVQGAGLAHIPRLALCVTMEQDIECDFAQHALDLCQALDSGVGTSDLIAPDRAPRGLRYSMALCHLRTVMTTPRMQTLEAQVHALELTFQCVYRCCEP